MRVSEGKEINNNGYIDIHVHARDLEERYKETVEHVLNVIAPSQNISIIFDMPNTKKPLIRKNDIERKLKVVPNGRENSYFLWIGITAEEDQIIEAISLVEDHEKVIGIKMFAGKSVGNLALVKKEEREKVYEILTKNNYKGVLAIHCEMEEFIRNNLFDPENPETHCLARPPEAEIKSVEEQIQLAKKYGFKGVLHICHTSLPETIELVDKARKEINITCGVTPHHLLWDKSIMEGKGKLGLIYKMNPPLREKSKVERLRVLVSQGKVDFLESDHAPHHIGEKLFPPYLSGFPSLYIYKKVVEEFLPNIGVEESIIENMTRKNALKLFGDKIEI